MERGITIHEMENVARGLNAPPDFSISSDIGNIIEISDSSDSLGLGMLANPGKMRGSSGSGSGSGSSSSSSSNTFSFNPSSGPGLAEVEIENLETLEPITLQVGGNQESAPIDITFSRMENEQSGGGGGGLFSNGQTASGPSFSLSAAPAPRVDPEVERQEKVELLNKLQRLEKKGFPVSKRFTMDNTLAEMNEEFTRLVDARNLEASIRFQRQALMSVVTGMEWLNGRFDPFDLKLDGWSEAVHENQEDFDDIFEELYDKYKERGKLPPEARLVMSLAGSGFMCHVSNTFLKSKMSNMSADDILKNNPDLARQFAAAAAQQAGPGFGSFMNMAMGGAAAPQAQQQAAFGGGPGAFFGSSAQQAAMPMAQTPQSVAAMEPPRSATARREMSGPKGPQVDDILQSFANARRSEAMEGSAYLQPSVSAETQPAVAAAMELQSVASDDIGSMADSTRTGGARGGRRRKAPTGNVVSLNV